jgi:radical SAM superfamily enzyme YgiQ (UPF0313 family)
MKSHTVVLIALNDYDNLGVGYIASVLSEAGFKTKIIDLRRQNSDILKKLKTINPVLVGFSIIFHNYIDHFTGLINYLRREGIKSHFTAGGHYASLNYEELFRLAPQLDSIVRFEGEYPIKELAGCLKNGTDWKKIRGLTYKEKKKIISNPFWPPEKNLDKLPFPFRSRLKKYAFNQRFSSIIAGRGCIHNCSFCNTREFYRQASGPLKRLRKPEAVVNEMEFLFNKRSCSVFLFHDDDFPVKSKIQSDWLIRFCKELIRAGLNKKIIWKINCRPDDLDMKTLSMMKRNGLFLAFIGIEDGTDQGLKKLNKNMTVEKCLEGVNNLKKLNIGFDYGFMLFQPSTTFKSLKKNLDFLKQLCGDGCTPVTFLKLMPFYATRVEKELINEGRLNFSDGSRDYDFIEVPMNHYYDFVARSLGKWLWDAEGLVNISKWARNFFLVHDKFYGSNARVTRLRTSVSHIISESNLFLLETMNELAVIFRSGQYTDNEQNKLNEYRRLIGKKHKYYLGEINDAIDTLVCMKTEDWR